MARSHPDELERGAGPPADWTCLANVPGMSTMWALRLSFLSLPRLDRASSASRGSERCRGGLQKAEVPSFFVCSASNLMATMYPNGGQMQEKRDTKNLLWKETMLHYRVPPRLPLLFTQYP